MSQANVQHFINIINNEKRALIDSLADEYGFEAEYAYNKFVLNKITEQPNDEMLVRKETVLSSESSTPTMKSPEEMSPTSVHNESHPPKPKQVKKKFVLPWSGVADDTCCQGLKNNYGIFTQCTNPTVSDCKFCKQCVVAIAKNGDDHPCGTVVERMAVGINDYKDPKGKKVIHYTQYMKRMDISKQDVIDLADGKFVDPSHFSQPSTKRGRPSKKNTIVNDSDDETIKKPGRPKKNTYEPSPQSIVHTILHDKLHTSQQHDHDILAHLRIHIPTSP